MVEETAYQCLSRAARQGLEPGLKRMGTLMEKLGHPEREVAFVHIAGTNGKGSTAAMLAQILSRSGLRTGLYTSPHLWRAEERIQVDGAPIPPQDFSAAVRRVLAAVGDGAYNEFELLTAVGLWYFARRGCRIAVLEVGLGGLMDPTNIIPPPAASAITNLGLEHTAILGNTIPEIAVQKAGILKTGTRAVLYHQSQEAQQVVEERCRALHIPLTITDPGQLSVPSVSLEGQDIVYRGRPYHLALLGPIQRRNAMTVLDLVDTLREAGWDIPQNAVEEGLAQAKWPGRLELAHRNPYVLLDGGHNPQCIQALAESLRELCPGKRIVYLAGVLADKDYAAMLDAALPLAQALVAITPNSPRALPAQELARETAARGVQACSQTSVAQGLETAMELAGPEGVVCAWGSLYSVGELRCCLGLEG